MLTPTLRCITKTSRSYISPLFQFNSFSSYASDLSLLYPTIKNPSLIHYPFSNPPSESHEIVSSFRDWFNTSKNPLFDRIFMVLSKKNEEELHFITRDDLGLSELGLHLSESFVLEVLDYRKDDVLSCLKFFDWAGRQHGFNHTRNTFVAIFKIMSRAKLTSLMLDLLDTFSKQRYLHRVRFNDMLVMGYALAGKVDIALQVFGRMRFQGLDLDIGAYNVLLNALVEEGCFDAAKVVMEQIRRRGHENGITRALVLKGLCKQGLLKEAEEYFRDLVGREVDVSGHMFAVLVNALCKSKRFLRAGRLIHELGEKQSVPMDEAYGVWIRDLVHAGKLDAAMEFFHEKKSLEGYVPKVYRYNVLIHRLLKENRLQEVCDLVMDMKESRIVPDKVTMNAVLCFFCKAGMMDVALELYNMRSDFSFNPHSMVYNYILNTLCGDGNTDEAYRVLKSSMSQGYFPGPRTFSILANALCREGKLDKMKDLVMFALERKFMPAHSTYEKFIRALCRAKRVEDGYLIHGELNRLNRKSSENTYAYLICAFNKASRGDLAARLLVEMQEKGHKPSPKLFKDVVLCVSEMEDEKPFLQLLEMQLSRFGHDVHSYGYFIYGAGHARKAELGRAVYNMMEKYDVVPDLSSEIFMLQCYLKSDRIADALNFFDDVSRRRRLGRKLYSSMVVGLCIAGKSDFASAIMREARKNRVTPSLQCYEELMKLYCSENKFDEAVRMINDMEKAGRKITSFIGNCLLLYSLHSKDVYQAWLRSRDVSDEESSILGHLLAVFSGHIRGDSEVEDLEELIQKCFPLDTYSYNMLLRRLSIDHIDRAVQLFKRLSQKGIEPNRWTYDIIVHGLYRHGRIAEGDLWAQEMLRRGFSPNECTQLLV